MANSKHKREELLHFIDHKVFDPILNAAPGQFREEDREMYEEVRRKTENEKEQFHRKLKTAREVKENYLSDVRSAAARKVNRRLEHLGLPTLPAFKDEFQELCRKLEV